MLSFRHDKVGFFFGLALIIVCGGTLIATLVLLIVGVVQGGYTLYLWPIRWVLFGWWIGCVVLVWLRVYIFDWQRRRPPGAPPSTPVPEAGVSLPVPSAEAEVARLLADRERYRAIGAIGVATVLGVLSALVIVSFLSASVQPLPGAAPVQIVAWSVGGGVIVVVVLSCVFGLRPRGPRPPPYFPAAREAIPSGVQEHRSSQ
jgi:hypothetical protein